VPSVGRFPAVEHRQATRQHHSAPDWLSDAVDVMVLAAVLLLTLTLAALL
jgi:hypothetical protein